MEMSNDRSNVQVLEPVQARPSSDLRREMDMTNSDSILELEDLKPVGTRISWGAILAGAAVSLGVYFLLGILGTAVGLTISNRMDPKTLTNSAIAWAVLTTCVLFFFVGIVASVLTVGENKLESMLYGLIMWAVLITFFVGLGAAGISTGLNAMTELSNQARNGTVPTWKAVAAEAGVPAEKIDKVRAVGDGELDKSSTPNAAVITETGTRLIWYLFFGLWLSMLTASLGALVGAGPTFRIAGFYHPMARTGAAPIPAHRS
jgi:hypothetical protein